LAYIEEGRVTETIEEEAMLMSKESYLSHGIHIGTRIATADMRPFIYRVRSDGLFVLDVRVLGCPNCLYTNCPLNPDHSKAPSTAVE